MLIIHVCISKVASRALRVRTVTLLASALHLLPPVVKVEIQRWRTVISGFGPLLVVVGPLLTVLDPLCLLLVAGPRDY